jgi:hypothetical protein
MKIALLARTAFKGRKCYQGHCTQCTALDGLDSTFGLQQQGYRLSDAQAQAFLLRLPNVRQSFLSTRKSSIGLSTS